MRFRLIFTLKLSRLKRILKALIDFIRTHYAIKRFADANHLDCCISVFIRSDSPIFFDFAE